MMSALPPLPPEDINDGEIRAFTYRHMREYGAICRAQGREEAIKAARVQALEEAAKVCDIQACKGWPRAHGADCADAIRLLGEEAGRGNAAELPEPAFRLTWRDGAYRVSKPNIGDTYCYTAEQVIALLKGCT